MTDIAMGEAAAPDSGVPQSDWGGTAKREVGHSGLEATWTGVEFAQVRERALGTDGTRRREPVGEARST